MKIGIKVDEDYSFLVDNQQKFEQLEKKGYNLYYFVSSSCPNKNIANMLSYVMQNKDYGEQRVIYNDEIDEDIKVVLSYNYGDFVVKNNDTKREMDSLADGLIRSIDMLSTKETGYPSIDKPWRKFFTDSNLSAKMPESRAYDFLYECNKNNMALTAINYFDNELTFEEMFEKIESATKAFQNLGVKKGDVVSFCMPTTPETIYSFYALNRLGAIANFIDLRTNPERIKKYINDVNSKYLVMLDLVYPRINTIIDNTNIEKVVNISVSDSMPLVTNFGYKAKTAISNYKEKKKGIKVPQNDTFIYWNDFIINGRNISKINDADYEKDSVAGIVYTGGTTGTPKGAMLTNDNFNNMAKQYLNASINVTKGQTFLNIMPPFIAYGIIGGIHMPLCTSNREILVPSFNSEKLCDYLIKYKPANFMGTPGHIAPLLKSKKADKLDLSEFRSPGVGGDNMNVTFEKEVNEFFENHNSPVGIFKGYGMTELSSTAISVMNNSSNKLGSVGIPFPQSSIKILDLDTKKEKKYYEEGEIYITSQTIFKGYVNNQSETDNVIVMDENGTKWVKTQDLGYVDEDGLVFITGRIKNIIIRPDGHNVSPKQIQEVVCMNEKVKNCCVVGMPAIGYESGKIPTAFIVLKEEDVLDKEQILFDIKSLCEKILPERDNALDFIIVDELPYTPIGKVDTKKLEDEQSKIIVEKYNKGLVKKIRI